MKEITNELERVAQWAIHDAQQISYACDTLKSVQDRYDAKKLCFVSHSGTRKAVFDLYPFCEGDEVVMHILHSRGYHLAVKLSLFEQQFRTPSALGIWTLIKEE
jgi:hypothetical protein